VNDDAAGAAGEGSVNTEITGGPGAPPRRPRRLRGGDRVVVVAPSGPVDPGRLERGCTALRSLGLDVVPGRHVFERDRYLAGTDADRAADLQEAWCAGDTAAVVCARGGYGAARVVDLLDWDAMRSMPPRVFVGGSDATALHAAIRSRLGLVTLFGPMPATVLLGETDPEPASLARLGDALLRPERAMTVHAGGRAVVPGVSSGVTVGGTLSLLATTAGTRDWVPAGGGVALLEDVGEDPYRVDRLLTHLLRAGWFDAVRGIGLGSFVDCGPDVEKVLAERLAPLGVPILAGLPFGHGPVQLTLPLGVPARLDADAGTLTLAQPALS